MNIQDALRDSLLKASPEFQRKFAVGIIRDLPRAERFRAIEDLGRSIERSDTAVVCIPDFTNAFDAASETGFEPNPSFAAEWTKNHHQLRHINRPSILSHVMAYAVAALVVAASGGLILAIIAGFTALIHRLVN